MEESKGDTMRNHRTHTRPGIPTRRAPRPRLEVQEPDDPTPTLPLLVEGFGDGLSRPRRADESGAESR